MKQTFIQNVIYLRDIFTNNLCLYIHSLQGKKGIFIEQSLILHYTVDIIHCNKKEKNVIYVLRLII